MTSDYPIIVLSSLILIIILAFFTTRLISRGFTQRITGKNIKFIEKLPLGMDKSLILIEVDKHFYLIYLSKNSAQLIDKLDSLEIKDTLTKNISFSNILSNFKSFKNK